MTIYGNVSNCRKCDFVSKYKFYEAENTTTKSVRSLASFCLWNTLSTRSIAELLPLKLDTLRILGIYSSELSSSDYFS